MQLVMRLDRAACCFQQKEVAVKIWVRKRQTNKTDDEQASREGEIMRLDRGWEEDGGYFEEFHPPAVSC